ncbi:Sugar kinase of the NBD/HSP70 family, may contain an N-terminal HTH domain [Chitinophaga costaii]|uniref:Sugar kinase of the NBD/HSP70 family, may contain an N-terminal HTH domain n=1 Tax=Chitinophaga costaii TaxID=1335309 RepID=A0A1C3ZMI6_9BACT|nr:ROK family protein [Chitinophaga costaii]PUZ30434.1 ROK family protein [Chitinophaga costaii]SCB83531.1 Sugar kinase of the NBD/HSP70 family, may contain an N-terminal HTH domain [Chitinophaga costaii]
MLPGPTHKNRKKTQLRNDLLKQLYYQGTLSLNELSSLVKKSLPLVTNTVNELLEEDYVVECGLAQSTGGRRPLTFMLNPEKPRYIVAVAIDQLVTRVVIYNLLNKAVSPVATWMLDLHMEQAHEKIAGFVKDYITNSGIPNNHLLGIGISMPGFINMEEGINHTFFKPIQGGIGEYLQQATRLTVFIDNDSSSIALAELKYGAAKGLKEVMVVNIGWGIGLGMIVNGQLFRGHSGLAGEFSHIPLSLTNNLCSCGKRGCLEVDASLLVVAEKAKSAMLRGEKSSLRELFEQENQLPGDQVLVAVKTGDPLAISLLAESTFMIGKGIATLIHIMNPERVVLSGRGATAGKILLAPVNQAINEFCIPRLAEYTHLHVSDLAHEAALLGAAALVMENCNLN